MFANLINPLAILISLSTATGVFVHDMKIDKATMVAVTVPAAMAASYASASAHKVVNFGDAHTHAERTSLSQAVNDAKAQNPLLQPRARHDKQSLLQKHAVRGHHAFDNYNLPVVS